MQFISEAERHDVLNKGLLKISKKQKKKNSEIIIFNFLRKVSEDQNEVVRKK